MNIANEIMVAINVVNALLELIKKGTHPQFSKEFVDNCENNGKAFRDHMMAQHQKAEAENKEKEVVDVDQKSETENKEAVEL